MGVPGEYEVLHGSPRWKRSSGWTFQMNLRSWVDMPDECHVPARICLRSALVPQTDIVGGCLHNIANIRFSITYTRRRDESTGSTDQCIPPPTHETLILGQRLPALPQPPRLSPGFLFHLLAPPRFRAMVRRKQSVCVGI